MQTLIVRFMGPTWGPSGAEGPRWAPCWPHELCYLGKIFRGCLSLHYLINLKNYPSCVISTHLYFTCGIFKDNSMNEIFGILTKILLTLVPKGQIGNKSTSVQVMAWGRTGNTILGGDDLNVYWNTIGSKAHTNMSPAWPFYQVSPSSTFRGDIDAISFCWQYFLFVT